MAREPEREVQREPQVVAGENEIPHQPEDRPYHGAEAPAGVARGSRAALWVGLVVLVGVAAVVIWAIVA